MSTTAIESNSFFELRSGPERIAVVFARILREAGLTAPLDSVLTFIASLEQLGIDNRNNVYWAGRASLVRRPEDISLYDRAFSVFWEHRETPEYFDDEEQLRVSVVLDDEDADSAGVAQPSDDPTITVRFSGVENLTHKDFASYSDDELDIARQLMGRLKLIGPYRRSLRRVPARRRTQNTDIRRTLRAAFASDGEVIRRRFTSPDERPRRIVLLLDVSGSMEPYARALVRFVHAAVVGRQRVEAFTLGTRLTRITRELNSRDPDIALRRASDSVADWSGGTRLGETLRHFNDRWGTRGMARGAVVVVLSDGWDRGSPDVLAEQMQRLSRVAHRIVWVNPLKVTPGYAPLARGMAAALPYVDDFIEGHSLDSLHHLTKVISNA